MKILTRNDSLKDIYKLSICGVLSNIGELGEPSETHNNFPIINLIYTLIEKTNELLGGPYID